MCVGLGWFHRTTHPPKISKTISTWIGKEVCNYAKKIEQIKFDQKTSSLAFFLYLFGWLLFSEPTKLFFVEGLSLNTEEGTLATGVLVKMQETLAANFIPTMAIDPGEAYVYVYTYGIYIYIYIYILWDIHIYICIYMGYIYIYCIYILDIYIGYIGYIYIYICVYMGYINIYGIYKYDCKYMVYIYTYVWDIYIYIHMGYIYIYVWDVYIYIHIHTRRSLGTFQSATVIHCQSLGACGTPSTSIASPHRVHVRWFLHLRMATGGELTIISPQ